MYKHYIASLNTEDFVALVRDLAVLQILFVSTYYYEFRGTSDARLPGPIQGRTPLQSVPHCCLQPGRTNEQLLFGQRDQLTGRSRLVIVLHHLRSTEQSHQALLARFYWTYQQRSSFI